MVTDEEIVKKLGKQWLELLQDQKDLEATDQEDTLAAIMDGHFPGLQTVGVVHPFHDVRAGVWGLCRQRVTGF